MYLARVGECPATNQVKRRGLMITVRKEMAAGMAMGALLLMLSGSALWAAEGSGKEGSAKEGSAKEGPAKTAEQTLLCAKCGEVSGTETCCKPAAACQGCGLHKGAPGCCALPKDAAGKVALCAGCGQVKGSETCCAKDAKKCEACGMAAASPGCKIKCAAK
jgi:hypothetical protein